MSQPPSRGLKGEVYSLLDESGMPAAAITRILSERHKEWNPHAINYRIHSYLSAMVADGHAIKRAIPGEPSLYAKAEKS